jgi:HlyD family secretion protein
MMVPSWSRSMRVFSFFAPRRALLAFGGLLLVGGCHKSSSSSTATPPGAVACLGHLIPGEGVIEIGAPYSLGGGPCIVAELRVRRGDRVQAGQILAVLQNYRMASAEAAAATAQVKVAEAALAQVRAGAKPDDIAALRANVAQREAELENERPAYARAQTLSKENSISTSDMEAAQRRFTVAERALDEARHRAASIAEVRAVDVAYAESQVALSRAQLASSEAQVEQSLLRAPIAGVVLDTLLQPGELAGTPVMSLGNTDAMGVEAYVYDTDIRRVRPGAAATITSYAFEGALTGRVTDVAPLLRSSPAVSIRPEAASDRRVVRARIALAPADAKRVANLSNQEVEILITP